MYQKEESWPMQSVRVAEDRSTFPRACACLHRCPEVKVRGAGGGRLSRGAQIDGRRIRGR